MRRFLFTLILLITGLLIPTAPAAAAGPRGCDFNGDGFDDLAVGAPYEDVSGIVDAGAVSVVYGTVDGLSATNAQFLHRGSPDIADDLGMEDYFGHDLTCGDFNNDGSDDLAVGVGTDDIGSLLEAGSVHVIYGSGAGLSTNDEVIHQDTPGIQGTAEAFDEFGYAVASGDFDDDGFVDLAVGTPFEEFNGVHRGGTVTVVYGSGTGLGTDDEVWHQDTPGIKGIAETDNFFGYTLEAGDFDGDGADDLVVGVPFEDHVGEAAGSVNVIYGSGSGLTASGDQLWDRDTPGIKGVAATDDAWGLALGVGDFDGDGRDDLVVGAPVADVGGVADAGSANVLYGSTTGLTDAGDQLFHQNTAGIQGTTEISDAFAATLTGGDFNNDGKDDLAAGVPRESIGATSNAGALMVIYGSATGLTTAGDQIWHQASSGIKGAAETNDFFGFPATTGDFDGDNWADVAIGVALEDRGADGDTGALAVLYGSPSGVSAADQLWDQSQFEVSEPGDSFGFTGGGHNWFV